MRESLLILTTLLILISLNDLSFIDCPLTACTDDLSGDDVVDAWDCTYMARTIAGVPGYSV